MERLNLWNVANCRNSNISPTVYSHFLEQRVGTGCISVCMFSSLRRSQNQFRQSEHRASRAVLQVCGVEAATRKRSSNYYTFLYWVQVLAYFKCSLWRLIICCCCFKRPTRAQSKGNLHFSKFEINEPDIFFRRVLEALFTVEFHIFISAPYNMLCRRQTSGRVAEPVLYYPRQLRFRFKTYAL